MTEPPERQPLALRIALSPVRALIAVLVICDELARPTYRPVIRWFAGLALVHRMERLVASLPPYAVLAVLAVPLVAVEPLKIIGVVWMGTGRFLPGLLMLAFAYGASFLVIERIYEAGREKLFRIRWFAAAMGYVIRVRDAALAWARSTAVYQAGRRWAAELREMRVRMVAGLRRAWARRA
ncbi:MAG: hypothetical protein U1E62_25980 [Alsobacter sp.]